LFHFKSPLWRSVFALVGLLVLDSYSSFSLAVYVCLKNTIVVTKKAKKL